MHINIFKHLYTTIIGCYDNYSHTILIEQVNVNTVFLTTLKFCRYGPLMKRTSFFFSGILIPFVSFRKGIKTQMPYCLFHVLYWFENLLNAMFGIRDLLF